jgi:Zn-dependent protease/CBS domain-containing protein
MNESFPLGRIAGIKVGVHWSLFVIAGLVAWGLADTMLPDVAPGYSDAAYVVAGAVGAVVFFAALLAHELGHSVVAIRRGVGVESITLWLFGGVARLTRDMPSPEAELRIASAGPAVSAGIAAACGALALLLDASDVSELAAETAAWLALVNGVLVVFNLVPGAPLDGGRILHAWVWRRTGDSRRATVVASAAGRGFGYVLIAVGIALALGGALGGIWFALIGWFLVSAATAEQSHLLLRGALAGVRVRDVMTPDPVTVPAGTTVAHLLEDVLWRHHCSAFPVVDTSGAVTGLVTLRGLRAVPGDARGGTSVDAVAISGAQVARAAPDEPLLDLLERMAATADRSGRALVFSEGRLVGIVSPSDVNRALEIASLRAVTDSPVASEPTREGDGDGR